MTPANHLAKQMKHCVRQGDTVGARQSLVELMRSGLDQALVVIQQQELLMCSPDPKLRSVLLNTYMSELLALKSPDELLRQQTIYRSYCELVGTVRDAIAQSASQYAKTVLSSGLKPALEYCCAAVMRRVRHYTDFVNSEAGRDELSPAEVALFHSDIGRQVSTLFDLLDPMLGEVYRASEAARDLGPSTHRQRYSAAIGLIDSAREWQAMIQFRQNVAWGFSAVDSVERGPVVYLSPRDWGRARTEVYARIRLGLFDVRRSPEDQLADVSPFKQAIRVAAELVRADFLALGHDVDEKELIGELERVVKNQSRPVDIVMFQAITDKDTHKLMQALWLLGLLANGYRYAGSMIRGFGFARRGVPFILPMRRDQLVADLVGLLEIDEALADHTITIMTADIRSGKPLELATHPFLPLVGGELGVLTLPRTFNLFTETRRILAEGNKTSKDVGEAYEGYIRNLFRAANCYVAPTRVALRKNGRPVTDIDVLAFKDGIFFAVQTKCLVEPNTVHSRWKALGEITAGTRQCLKVSNYVDKNRQVLFDAIPGIKAADWRQVEVCSVVVSPSLHFGADTSWPVFVIDDAYLNHIVTIGEARLTELRTGNVVATMPLYSGTTPSGEELRDLITYPKFRDLLGAESMLLESRIRVRNVEIADYDLHIRPKSSEELGLPLLGTNAPEQPGDLSE